VVDIQATEDYFEALMKVYKTLLLMRKTTAARNSEVRQQTDKASQTSNQEFDKQES